DHVDVRRPIAAPQLRIVGIAQPGDVVGESVEPHVHHVTVAAGHGHTPVEAGARDAEILEAALDEADHFVAAALRPDELRVRRIMIEQRLLVLGQAEEPALLDRPFYRRSPATASRRPRLRPAPLPRNRLRRGPNTNPRSGPGRGLPSPPSQSRLPGWRDNGRAATFV